MIKHTLICGITQSGKTTMAKLLARMRSRAGRKVLVLDPILDNDWPAHLVTDDPEKYLEIAQSEQTRNCTLVVDEGRMALARDERFSWLTTTSRHSGHDCIIISHRPTGLTPELRSNCVICYAFNIHEMDAELLSRNYNRQELLQAPSLPQGEYIRCEAMKAQVQYGNVFEEYYGKVVDSDTD